MKKILVSAGVVAMGFALASTAFASSSAGSQSPVTTKVIQVTTTTVSNSNSSSVENQSSVIVGTGQNSISTHTGDVNGASIVSGNGTANSTVTNSVNMINATVTAPATTNSEAVGSPSDTSAGSQSPVTSVVVQKDQAAFGNSNSGTVLNGVSAATFTGKNKVSSHTGDLNGVGIQSGVGMGTTSIGNTVGGITFVLTR